MQTEWRLVIREKGLHRGRMMRIYVLRCRLGYALDTAGVDRITQLFRGLEERDPFGGNVDALAGLGVTTDAGVALAGAEAAKAADFNLVAGLERTDDRFEE